jgi:hypothetical protein
MRILLYIVGIKLFLLTHIYFMFFTKHELVSSDNNFSDGEAFLFKTFIIDAAVGN